jgi:hypothetical protein
MHWIIHRENDGMGPRVRKRDLLRRAGKQRSYEVGNEQSEQPEIQDQSSYEGLPIFHRITVMDGFGFGAWYCPQLLSLLEPMGSFISSTPSRPSKEEHAMGRRALKDMSGPIHI